MIQFLRKFIPERYLRRLWNKLRLGRPIRIGPVSLIWSHYLADLEYRAAAKGSQPTRTGLRPPTQRSAVFLHNAYYNFLYLARALRERGWDAISVSMENPNGPNAWLYHGEDLNLYDSDPGRMIEKTGAFFEEVKTRFQVVHFHGIGQMTFFPSRYDFGNFFTSIPEDFLELKRLGIKIGHTYTGCNQGIAQTSFHRWSGGCCDRCVWQHEPQVCSDRHNLSWGHKVEQIADFCATEGQPALDFESSRKCYREPLTLVLDQEVWKPDLDIPEQFRLPRADGELLVYHGVGNFQRRSLGGRNIKGTPAVMAAIERLQGEGMKVRLEFVTGRSNLDVRFIQAQCDVVVDQLNFGRYGATARESMMLGKPTIGHLIREEEGGIAPSAAISECPIVSANEDSIYSVLRDLLLDADKRQRIGRESRAFALKWHSATAGAERYERVYDAVMRGIDPADVR
jgi:glycosyltransferase involved in cell wall biosynthesis